MTVSWPETGKGWLTMHISCKGGVRPCFSRGGGVKSHEEAGSYKCSDGKLATPEIPERWRFFSCTSITQSDNYLYLGKKTEYPYLSQRKALETPKAATSLQLWAEYSILASIRLDVPRAGGLLHLRGVVFLQGG